MQGHDSIACFEKGIQLPKRGKRFLCVICCQEFGCRADILGHLSTYPYSMLKKHGYNLEMVERETELAIEQITKRKSQAREGMRDTRLLKQFSYPSKAPDRDLHAKLQADMQAFFDKGKKKELN